MATSHGRIEILRLADKRLRLVSHLSEAMPTSTPGEDAVPQLTSPSRGGACWRYVA